MLRPLKSPWLGDGDTFSDGFPKSRTILVRRISLHGTHNGLLTGCPAPIGSPSANYTIGWSCPDYAGSGCALEKIIISGGPEFLTVGGEISLGRKDKSPAVQRRDNYYTTLAALLRHYVVFYDTATHRAWLTNGLHTLLHLLRTSLKHDLDSELVKDCLFDPSLLKEQADASDPRAAIEFLRDINNLEQPIFPNLDDNRIEETTVNGISTKTEHRSSSIFQLKHRIGELLHVLEQLIDHQARASGNCAPGIPLKATPRSQLEGYRLMDVATGRSPVPRVVSLRMFRGGGKSWVDFVREIHAVTLFGEGFGELLSPAAGSATPCVNWETLAEGRDYLAVASFDLARIIKENGSSVSNPLKLAPGIFWHTPAQLFEPCACKGKAHRILGVAKQKTCDRVQVLLSPVSRRLSAIRTSSPNAFNLNKDGAVIFGRSKTFPLLWPDRGDPQQESRTSQSAASVSTAEDDFIDSGVGLSSSLQSTASLAPSQPMATASVASRTSGEATDLDPGPQTATGGEQATKATVGETVTRTTREQALQRMYRKGARKLKARSAKQS